MSLNYRLGPFGWLSLSQYGGALEEATKLGLQDIVTGLRWVRENIARFGGDPDNVTVTGHSAGAFSALGLLAAPSADGLYHHIAAFSGIPSRLVPAWGAEERALAALTALGIQDDPEQLLNIDAKLLAETMSKTQSSDPGAAHGVDNEVIAIVDDRNQPMDEHLAPQRVPMLGLMLGLSLDASRADQPLSGPQLESARANPADPRSSRALEIAYQGWPPREILAHGVFDYAPSPVGPPEAIADYLQDAFDAGIADGFWLQQATFAIADDFVDEVVPILQKRGLYHRDYQGPRCASTWGCRGSMARTLASADPSSAIRVAVTKGCSATERG